MPKYEITINSIEGILKAQCVINGKHFEILDDCVIQTKPYTENWRSEILPEELRIIIQILEFNNID